MHTRAKTGLWQDIVAFSFEKPGDEYGFSVRLADENKWTKAFTEKAILEYKKFMYLAATASEMVSPSEIVDVVWHQHLIFTQSYQKFCRLLGKDIQHIPSTHNPEEAEKFSRAKEQTRHIYTETFGEQPADVWQHRSMYDSSNLTPAKKPLSQFISVAVIVGIVLLFPAYYLLLPFYENIDGMYFLAGFVPLAAAVALLLNLYNNAYLKSMLKRAEEESFVYNLHPLEVLYGMTGSLPLTLHGYVNQLLQEGKIKILPDEKISLAAGVEPKNEQEARIFKVLQLAPKTSYALLIKTLAAKPFFTNIAKSMDSFKARVRESKAFAALYRINFMVISGLLLLGTVRLLTGVFRGKPIVFLLIALVFLLSFAVQHLRRLSVRFFTDTIPRYYDTDLADMSESRSVGSKYILSTAFITGSYLTLPQEYSREGGSGASGGCGSSCGSSCGGGCGGCGGCGG